MKTLFLIFLASSIFAQGNISIQMTENGFEPGKISIGQNESLLSRFWGEFNEFFRKFLGLFKRQPGIKGSLPPNNQLLLLEEVAKEKGRTDWPLILRQLI